MRTRVIVASVLVVLILLLRLGWVGPLFHRVEELRVSTPAWDAARFAPGDPVTDVELLALDGRTAAHLLGRGTNRPLIVIVAATGSPALDHCASRWRELFEIYKDRVEFLTVFVAAPDSGAAASTVRVRPGANAATDTGALDATLPRVEAAITFVTCNNWRIPVLVDGPGGGAAAQFGTAPQVALVLDESRRRLGAPVAAEVPSDLDPVSAWLRHRFAL